MWGVSPVVVGALIVGMGTSAPELLVSVLAALEGDANLAIGNAVGSNVSNVTLVIGVTALVAPQRAVDPRRSLVHRISPRCSGAASTPAC